MPGEDNVLRAFGEEHVAQLTGLSRGQLRAWHRRGFFVPHHAYEDSRSAYSRVYSFKDVVGLRAIAVLKKNHRVSMAQLVRAARGLEKRGYNHWADTKLYVLNGQVYFKAPGSKHPEGVRDGQLAMLPVIDVINDVTERVQALRDRAPEQIGKVERHKYVARNASVVAGTRIPTAAIRRFREAGYRLSAIQVEYPSLTVEDVKAALAYEERLAKIA